MRTDLTLLNVKQLNKTEVKQLRKLLKDNC